MNDVPLDIEDRLPKPVSRPPRIPVEGFWDQMDEDQKESLRPLLDAGYDLFPTGSRYICPRHTAALEKDWRAEWAAASNGPDELSLPVRPDFDVMCLATDDDHARRLRDDLDLRHGWRAAGSGPEDDGRAGFSLYRKHVNLIMFLRDEAALFRRWCAATAFCALMGGPTERSGRVAIFKAVCDGYATYDLKSDLRATLEIAADHREDRGDYMCEPMRELAAAFDMQYPPGTTVVFSEEVIAASLLYGELFPVTRLG